jgi:hypothetical protein
MVNKAVWWTVSTASAILSVFFLFLGIELCRASYKLDHPQQFILTFFASNFIILISAVFLAAVVVRMLARLRHGQTPPDERHPQPALDHSQHPDKHD